MRTKQIAQVILIPHFERKDVKMTKLNEIFYSPPENHLGVIYWRERFSQFVTPQQWTIVRPFRHVFKEICLDPRTAQARLENVFTGDQIPLDLYLKVFYRVDPRQADRAQLIQVLHFPDEAWETIVRTNIEEIARNRVFIGKLFNELFTLQGRQDLRHQLSKMIAERVRGFGMIINPLYGVAVINLQPNQTFLKALQDQSAAIAQSEAAIRRILPILDRLGQGNMQTALQAIFLQTASAIGKNGDVPDIIMPGTHEFPFISGISGNGHKPVEPNLQKVFNANSAKSIGAD